MEMEEIVPNTRIQFNELNFTIPLRRKENKLILKSVSGEFRSGQLTAIMGPSGAGKTTLMSVLAGFKVSNATGDITVNNELRNLKEFQKSSCLITQRDELCQVLTVMEYMQYAVDLKIGEYLSQERKKELIEDILKAIGISHCVDTRAGKLSGGEKKRLAISLELISNPQIMFFDEPTTGLDSLTCFQCVSILKSLAQEGRAIICVIHQPSSSIFEMFDQLYLLADGQCVYQGPTANVITSIEKTTGLVCPIYHSPADFAIDIAIRRYGNEAVDKLLEQNKLDKFGRLNKNLELSRENRNSSIESEFENEWGPHETAHFSNCQNVTAQLSNCRKIHETGCTQYKVSKWTQFRVIIKKLITCILRDQLLTKTRGIAQLVFAFLTGIIYFGIGDESSQVINNFKLIFFTHLGLVVISLMTIVFTFPMERKVLLREYLNKWYRLDVYYLAKTLADFPLEILNTCAFVTIIYFMTNQPSDAERFFKFLSLGVMSGLVAQGVGAALGAALSLQAAVFIGPPTVIPFCLFAGALIRFQEIPSYMQWICSLVFMRYGFVGKMISVYDSDRPPLQCSEEFCYFKAPTKILQWLYMDDEVYWVNVAALFGFFFLIRVLAYFVLLWKLKSKL